MQIWFATAGGRKSMMTSSGTSLTSSLWNIQLDAVRRPLHRRTTLWKVGGGVWTARTYHRMVDGLGFSLRRHHMKAMVLRLWDTQIMLNFELDTLVINATRQIASYQPAGPIRTLEIHPHRILHSHFSLIHELICEVLSTWCCLRVIQVAWLTKTWSIVADESHWLSHGVTTIITAPIRQGGCMVSNLDGIMSQFLS